MKIPSFDLICHFEEMSDKVLLTKAPLGMCQQRALSAMVNGCIYKLDGVDEWSWEKPTNIHIVAHKEATDDTATSGEV